MNGFIRLLVLGAMIANLSSCVSRSVDDDVSLDIDGAGSSDLGFNEAQDDELGEFEDGDDSAAAEVATTGGNDDFDFDAPEASDTASDVASKESTDSISDDFADDLADTSFDEPAKASTESSLDDEFAEFDDSADSAVAANDADSDFGDSDLAADAGPAEETDIVDTTPPPDLDVPEFEEAVPQEIAEAAPEETAPMEEPAFSSSENADFAESDFDKPVATEALARITNVRFQANDSGGTVIVEGNQPLNFKTRANPDLNQYVIEVENATLPPNLKRSLNTKDIAGSVGAIDAYQNPGSTTARFVIQMREGMGEPAVQQEGNSLLIVTNSTPGAGSVAAAGGGADTADSEYSEDGGETTASFDSSPDKILPSQSLTEFLSGNAKFYGKKISIETNNMDVRDALSLITEESGVNMIISDEVKGAVNLKLRQVPWDQALVVLMRTKKLGYTRQGNVLRVAPLTDLKAEEDDVTKRAIANKALEPLVVRMFPISYAKVDELDKKIKDFLGERGKVVGDVRTNALVVTDTQENVDRVAKLISSLDTQPPQVSIEGKIVEATESFTRNIGVNWGASGAAIKLGNTARGPVNMTPSFNINQGAGGPGSAFSGAINVGTLDVFGTLSAALSLNEINEQVKIISAPRITTMSNEKAEITQTTEVAVKQVTQNGTATQETFTFKPLTLKLDVTPQVTADGSVIMKVAVNRQFRGADVSMVGNGAFSVNSREANTRVLVKNGQTAVIGGIYQSDATDGEAGVPWIKEVPLLKYLFRTSNVTKDKSELLIFLTPRILGDMTGGANVGSSDL